MGELMLAGAGVLLLFIIVITWIVVRSVALARRIATTAPEPISLLVVEELARARQFRAGLMAALFGAGAVALLRTPPFQMYAMVPILVTLIDLQAYLAARSLLGMLGGEVRAEAKHCRIQVYASDLRIRTIDVTPRALAAAKRAAVPRSTAS
jgi:hypothetical protein